MIFIISLMVKIINSAELAVKGRASLCDGHSMVLLLVFPINKTFDN